MPPAKTQSAAPVKPVDMAAIARAAAILEAGGLVAMPTETVYGLAADADQEAAVTATYRAKGRPLNHPLIVHVASADDIPWWAEITLEAQKLADRYWPGPLTMVLKKKPRCGNWVTGGQDTVALRCPSHPWAHALLAAYGGDRK
ncbi:L-threonylcarbamoyladenylate synthase, partial [Sutterella wadsworthensis]|uniref:L-threonylcarbamoyladenylate synthase n=1 Tax=Sutterella wadsworthensis TaxID=40545 RepID=UPI00307F0C1E